MQSQSEIINTNMQTWTEEEIRELILYAKKLQEEVETKTAQIIMIQTALDREEKKVTRLTNMIKFLTNGGEIHYS